MPLINFNYIQIYILSQTNTEKWMGHFTLTYTLLSWYENKVDNVCFKKEGRIP